MVAADGRITLANKPIQALTGLSLDEIVGRRLPELPHAILNTLGYTPHQAEELISRLGQSRLTPSLKFTFQEATDSASEKIYERSTAPVWGHGGHPMGWIIVICDVTEEHQVNKARELLTETLVHDLRSPMSAIWGSLDLIAEGIPESKRDGLVGQSLHIARRSARRVLRLIESLLDIARLESGSMELSPAQVNLHDLAADLVEDMTPQANEHGIFLCSEVPETLPLVRVDPNLIARVLTNLLDNALKFTPEGGQVIVSAEVQAAEGVVAVHVSDSGPGIPAEFREKIFERFSQIPDRRGRRRGSGLGLTFCRLAVEVHGGRIWVEPRPEGGSTFTFILPIT